MDVDPRHPERVGYQTGMLPARAAETMERVAGYVVPALHRDLLNCVRHVGYGDFEKPVRDLNGSARIAGCCVDLRRELRELFLHDAVIQFPIAIRPEDRGEQIRRELAGHDVAIGHRQRSAAPVTGRPWIGSGGIRTHAITRSIEMADGAAACRYCVDIHHRRAQAHSGHYGFEAPLEGARIMGDVRGCAAHVETDNPVVACRFGCACRTHNSTRRTGEDGILPLEQGRVRQTSA